MLGHALSAYFGQRQYHVTRLTREVFNALSSPLNELEKYIDSAEQVLINCIVNDVKSSDYQETIEVNALFPRRLAYFCAEKNIRLIHISTNGVFSGAQGNYRENDMPDPIDLYGISKLLGENTDCMVLRTSIIGTERFTSKYLLQWAISQRGKEVNGFTNHYWNGVTTLALAQAIESIINNDFYTKGVFHLYSDKTVSKFDLLSMLNQIYALNLRINPVEAKEGCDRTLSSIHELSSQVITTSLVDQVKMLKSCACGK